jgi:Ca2+-binding RTX toxin-like protein
MPTPFEPLERREMLAGDFDFSPIVRLPEPLFVTGAYSADVIHVSFSAYGEIVVNKNGSLSYHDPAYVSKLVISGWNGNDRIQASADFSIPLEIDAGYGNDTVFGGAASDTLHGSAGTDLVAGNGGNDTLYGGLPSHPYIEANSGYDILLGGYGNDRLHAAEFGYGYLDGGYGNDTLYGANASDTLLGSYDNDFISASGGNDIIRGGDDHDTVYAGQGDDNVRGDAGNDRLYGQDGHDRLYGDAGNDYLSGGWGNDTLVSIGGGQSDTLAGDGHSDSFWCDAEATEVVWDADAAEAAAGHVHRVAAFRSYHYNGIGDVAVSRELLGQNLSEPINAAGNGLTNFSSRPLFAAGGPHQDDIDQNGLADCYFLATLGAIADSNPDRIRQSVVELGDGTYAVRFYRDGREHYVRVDGDLPTSNGTPVFAGLGTEGSVWVAIMEKAFAFFRHNNSNWNALNGGRSGDVFERLGSAQETRGLLEFSFIGGGANYLWDYINASLGAGRAVTIATPDRDAGPLVKNHVYMVDYVYLAADGTRRIVLRNPWGPNNTNGNPYVDLSATQLFNNITRVCTAQV